ncbi:hypothetical protein KKI24_28915 [bacterium]|nr:hypothetical protein [bacterium]
MTTELEEINAFRNILRTKPTMAGLAGSVFEEIITSYVGQKGAANIFEAERLHQERFLQLAQKRESIVARAEMENYIPAMPVPFELQTLVKNAGPATCFIPYRHELTTEEQVKLVLNNNATLVSGESTTINAQQLWKETITYITTGQIFEEFTIGGVDEQGIFTPVEFTVKINGSTWENRQNFRNADSDSKVYHTIYKVSDELAIRLGNGDTGMMPEVGSELEITVWHTKGDRVFIIADQKLTSLVSIFDYSGNPAQLTFTTGNYVRKGQPQEEIELIRKHTLSQIQQGTVTARNSDYEFIVQKAFPELVYLKVWGEREQKSEYGYNLDYINKIFFAFLIENEENTAEFASDIVDLLNNIIKPMNVDPENVDLIKDTFQIDIQGKIDRTYVASSVGSALTTLLMGKFGLYKNVNGKLNVSDIYAIIQATEYFRDTQPHLNRKNKPYFKVTLSGTVEASFFDKYVYLDAITFGDDDGGTELGYISNI